MPPLFFSELKSKGPAEASPEADPNYKSGAGTAATRLAGIRPDSRANAQIIAWLSLVCIARTPALGDCMGVCLRLWWWGTSSPSCSSSIWKQAGLNAVVAEVLHVVIVV